MVTPVAHKVILNHLINLMARCKSFNNTNYVLNRIKQKEYLYTRDLIMYHSLIIMYKDNLCISPTVDDISPYCCWYVKETDRLSVYIYVCVIITTIYHRQYHFARHFFCALNLLFFIKFSNKRSSRVILDASNIKLVTKIRIFFIYSKKLILFKSPQNHTIFLWLNFFYYCSTFSFTRVTQNEKKEKKLLFRSYITLYGVSMMTAFSASAFH
jgi:hypothetical protein